MEFKNILNCKNKEEFSKWLNKNHLKEKECWIECKRGKLKEDNVFYYIDAVYVALSYGWIDSTLKKHENKLLQRFTPRQKNSKWSELNKERCRWLIKNNLMKENGYKQLPNLDKDFQINEEVLKIIKSDKQVYENFNNFPDLYKRIRAYNLVRDIKNEKSIKNFLEKTKNNKLYGDWNDNGRLL